MKFIILYKTLIEGSQYWKKFDKQEDAYGFTHKRSFLSAISSYQIYKISDTDETIMPVKFKSQRKSKPAKISPIETPKHPDKPRSFEDIPTPPVPSNKIKDPIMKATLDREKEKEEKETVTKTDKPFSYESGASRSGQRTSRNGKTYIYYEELGNIDESTAKTDHYELNYSFGNSSRIQQSFLTLKSNREAINEALGMVKVQPSSTLSLYNLDKTGNKTNLLYSYEFKGIA